MCARLAKLDAVRGYVCTGDCREANLRGWMQAQACYNWAWLSTYQPCQRGILETLSSLAAGERSLSTLLPSRSCACIALLDDRSFNGPQTHPSVIRGSLDARSHNYAVTRHISLSMAAKQGLETYRETV